MKEQLKDLWMVAVVVLLLSLLLFVLPLYAQAQAQTQAQTYTVTQLFPFLARAVASPYVVGEEANVPIRLDLRTGEKFVLEHQGLGASVLTVRPSGEAVGLLNEAFNGASVSVATHWDADGNATKLSEGPSVADAINAHGIIAGWAGPCVNDHVQAFRWHPDGTEESVGPVGCDGPNIGLDDQGNLWANRDKRMIVYLVDGTPVDLGPGGFAAVNAQGMAVKTTFAPPETVTVHRGSLTMPWQPFPNMTNPRTGRPADLCTVQDINGPGDIVGGCGEFGSFYWPTLWRADGTPVDLTSVATPPEGFRPEFRWSVSIDDQGVILVRQLSLQSQTRIVLLTPIEPRPLVAGQCGGSVPCQCGDTVVQDYVLTENLYCDLQGFEAALVIASGVNVTNGPRSAGVVGTGDGTGILFDGTQNSRVQVHAVGFREGVLMRAGAALNAYYGAVTHSNSQYGIRITEWANSNIISTVSSVWNGIAGISIEGTGWNSIQYSNARSNPVSLELRNTTANIVWSVGLWGDYGFALALANANGNNFAWDYLNEGQVMLVNSPTSGFPGPGTTNLCPVVEQNTVASR